MIIGSVRLFYVMILVLGLSMLKTPVMAQDGFDDFKEQYRQGYTEFLDRFENGVAQSQQDYENYERAYQEEYEKFKEQMLEQWGDFKERSSRQWVEYKEKGRLRISTDLKAGNGKVEVLVDSKEEAGKIKNEMGQKIAKALQLKGTREGFETEKLPNKTVTEEPVLQNQLQKAEDETVNDYAQRLAEEETKVEEVKGDDGKTRYVVYVDFKLADDHLRKRAEKVEDNVYKFAAENNLDPALVFAVIHVESYFNPTAASHANAYGLMQIVPTTGGRDAYREVFDKDGIPTKEFLFQPANNIKLGCAFIDILTSHYFSGIKDDKTRKYLMISAYNTGIGNVAKAYIGRSSLSASFDKINAMNAQQNYDYLRKNLEYAEARSYLKKVTERQKQYQGWKREVQKNR